MIARLTRIQFRLSAVTAFSVLLLGSTLCQAEIYRWKDAEGNTVYSDQKQSESAEKATLKDKNVNYYAAPKAKPATVKPIQQPVDTLATLEAMEDKAEDDGAMSEAECQQQYRRSCEQVDNWEKYALEDCGNDPRCDDPDYLDRKYRPRTTDEMREVARRAGVRKNNIDDKIDDYLRKKFTNQCENQARLYCQQQRSRNCLATVEAQCKDPRSLRQVLAKYDHLSPVEKQAIIEKASKMAVANGENSLDYDQLVASLVDILITSTLMGL